MIEFFSSWVKTIGLTIVIVSILEMLLPNNNNKKYIRMVMGLYVLFTIISPFISNKDIFIDNINDINFEDYIVKQTSSNINQTSMNKRLEELYTEELEKDIKEKLEKQGYLIKTCRVNVQISDKKEETKITKIKVKAEKSKNEESENESKTENIENQIVAQIQKIKPVDTSIKNQNTDKATENEQLDKSDIRNIKKFLIDEYEVNEKCLEIN